MVKSKHPPVWTEPVESRMMVLRFMYGMARSRHMSLHTFLMGVLFLDASDNIPLYQPWNHEYFKATVALLLAFAYDDGHRVVLAKHSLAYECVTEVDLFQICEHYLALWLPVHKPAPGVVLQYWVAMLHALDPEHWLVDRQVPLYRRLVGAVPPAEHTRLFQLLWVMPLVPLPVDQQEALALALLAGDTPPAAAALCQLPRRALAGPPYPDFVWLDSAFPQLAQNLVEQ
jgi:hypothetical protein